MLRRKTTHLHFLLLPGYADLSLSSALETLQCFNAQFPADAFSWSFGSAKGEAVAASVGTVFPADLMSEPPRQPEALVVVSGLGVERNCSRAILSQLRRAHLEGAMILGLSTGAFAIAKAGLLGGGVATIHWKYRSSFAETFHDIGLASAPYIFDGRVGTTAGGVAAIDLMLDFIAKRANEDAAAQIALHMNYSSIRALNSKLDVSSPHYLSIRHPILRRVVSIMEQNVEDPLTLPELAQPEGISTRQLERLFKRYLQSSPIRFYKNVRLTKARQLLIQTNMTITEIALATGFSSSTQFSKQYRHIFGTRPSQARLGQTEP